MNQQFLFKVKTYAAGDARGESVTQCVLATGSQETRARRRLLEALHRDGLFADSIELLKSRPVERRRRR